MRMFGVRPSVRARWDISKRPQYLLGLVTAAQQARLQKISGFSAVEFGVACGNGLLSLQEEAHAVSLEYGLNIKVFGFDLGTGLPPLGGDHRDHPDIWAPGDYAMDEALLRSRLDKESELILGDIKQTVPTFFAKFSPPPLGFISIDLDLYSSTRPALEILAAPDKKMLLHVPIYVDDIDMVYTHRRGGELLAIDEFNQAGTKVFIDRWRGIKGFRPFPEAPYLERFFIAHDLAAISQSHLDRQARRLPLTG